MALATLDGAITRVNHALRRPARPPRGGPGRAPALDELVRRPVEPRADPGRPGEYEATTRDHRRPRARPRRRRLAHPRRRRHARGRCRSTSSTSPAGAPPSGSGGAGSRPSSRGRRPRPPTGPRPISSPRSVTSCARRCRRSPASPSCSARWTSHAERRAAALSHIAEAADHILTMVDEVLDVARIEARALPLALRRCRARAGGGRRARHGRAARRRRAGDAVARRRPAEPVHVRADERRVRQVLLNLVTNAIRYNRPGGTVLVGWTRRRRSRCAITVRDTGPGIAPEHLDRLFTPFDRLGRDSDGGRRARPAARPRPHRGDGRHASTCTARSATAPP